METLIEILKYTLPALIVLIFTYLIIGRLLNAEQARRKTETVLNNHKLVTPIRLQAYERMVLFLERISLQSIVIRLQKSDMSSQDLQNALLKSIRSEFEHNVAHQLYISDKAWEMIKSAKEQLTRMINQTALQVKPDSPAINFSKMLLEKAMDIEKDPIRNAILYLKGEIRELF